MAKLLIILMILCHTMLVWSQSNESTKDENGSHFTGRISRLNSKARLARIRTDFENIKFLNRKDRVEFWNETYPDQRCMALVEGRTNDYLLLKISQFDQCVVKVHFTTGSYLHFQSPDLAQTVKIAKELVEILLKKRLAMQAKKDRHQKDLSGYVEKVDAVNKRYEVLRQKLEIEWQKELSNLEEDKSRSFTEFKNAEARLNEIDTKLEAYRVEDHNLKLDRWSLDPALYIKK
ncbi:hypothetical protein [Peredibacter starrii]|uniref:Uncharacterized protein n=1 Tax=Peredibacter starrii TaxID=28202 RepID=A0AAX4HRC4_9BACT|nr:hypothetical protein [Peredibacter starrii]WPU65767.1 hypothetical protein SOO65_03310 [Peredibacter starrii]